MDEWRKEEGEEEGGVKEGERKVARGARELICPSVGASEREGGGREEKGRKDSSGRANRGGTSESCINLCSVFRTKRLI